MENLINNFNQYAKIWTLKGKIEDLKKDIQILNNKQDSLSDKYGNNSNVDLWLDLYDQIVKLQNKIKRYRKEIQKTEDFFNQSKYTLTEDSISFLRSYLANINNL